MTMIRPENGLSRLRPIQHSLALREAQLGSYSTSLDGYFEVCSVLQFPSLSVLHLSWSSSLPLLTPSFCRSLLFDALSLCPSVYESIYTHCVSGAASLLDSCTLVLHTWTWWTHLLVITWFSGYERPSQTFSWCLIVELSLSLLPSTCVFALFHSINITYISFSSLQKPGGGSERDCCGERKLWINLLELWASLLGNPFCLKPSLWLSCK